MSLLESFRDLDGDVEAQSALAYLDNVTHQMQAIKGQIHALVQPRPGQRILDVGCGTGDDAAALAAGVAPYGLVIALDHSDEALSRARRHIGPETASTLRLTRADAHDIPLADGTCDAVRIERTLQHVADPPRVLAEMHRVLRPGGTLVASEPDWETLTIHPSQPLSGRVRHVLAHERIRHATIGRQLAPLITQLKMHRLEVHPMTLVLRSYAAAASVLDLETAVAMLTRDSDHPWLRELQDRDRRGEFFASVTGFTIRAWR